MRAIGILFFSVFCLPFFVFAQDASDTIHNIKLNEIIFDFGKIPQGRPVSHVFRFQNVSSQDILINHIQASCGCTTPEWDHEPIKSGGFSEIRVGFNAEAIGPFEKSISIQLSNGKNEFLSINGIVWKTPEQPAPFNEGLRNLRSRFSKSIH